jgi:hypothetical protein
MWLRPMRRTQKMQHRWRQLLRRKKKVSPPDCQTTSLPRTLRRKLPFVRPSDWMAVLSYENPSHTSPSLLVKIRRP